MNITVRYFASIREAAGTASEELDTEAGTIAELRAELLTRGGPLAQALAPGRAVRMALNQALAKVGGSNAFLEIYLRYFPISFY